MDKAKGKNKHEWCWSCGEKTMQPKVKYVQCTDCGATYNDVPKLGLPIVEPGKVIITTAGGPIKVKAQHPMKNVARRISKARTETPAS